VPAERDLTEGVPLFAPWTTKTPRHYPRGVGSIHLLSSFSTAIVTMLV